MMKQPKIAAISSADLPLHVHVTWADRSCSIIDLSDLVADLAVFAPLEDPATFAKAQVGEWGWSVRWNDEIDLGADTLWRLSLEQSGEAMSPRAFREWRHRNKLSQAAAGTALGLGKRMIIYYEQGEKIIPKTVLLATAGYDAKMGKSDHVHDATLMARFIAELSRKAS
jgi:DNA-binding XRE family transcriptional regulator